MKANKPVPDVDGYIAQFPDQVQTILKRIRSEIHTAAPEAVESISYGMPAYKQNDKSLVYFAAYPSHIGFYATPQGHEKFASELARYKQGKGSVQFPLDQPIPYDLIARMTAFKAAQQLNEE